MMCTSQHCCDKTTDGKMTACGIRGGAPLGSAPVLGAVRLLGPGELQSCVDCSGPSLRWTGVPMPNLLLRQR